MVYTHTFPGIDGAPNPGRAGIGAPRPGIGAGMDGGDGDV